LELEIGAYQKTLVAKAALTRPLLPISYPESNKRSPGEVVSSHSVC
jgi:hypothetical protein